MSGQYLDDEQILIVSVPLACAIGLNQSIVLRRLYHWIKVNKEAEKYDTHYNDGYWWAYNTYEGWQSDRNFNFWSLKTIERLFLELEALGLILSTPEYNKFYPMDKTKWYTIDYEAYGKFLSLWHEHNEPRAGASAMSTQYKAFLNAWAETKSDRSTRQVDVSDTSTCPIEHVNLSASDTDKLGVALPVSPLSSTKSPQDIGEFHSPEPPATENGQNGFEPDCAPASNRGIEAEEEKTRRETDAIDQLQALNPYERGSVDFSLWEERCEAQRQLHYKNEQQNREEDQECSEQSLKEGDAETWFVRLMHDVGTDAVTVNTLKTSAKTAFEADLTYWDGKERINLGSISHLYQSEPFFAEWAELLVNQKATPIMNHGARPKVSTVLGWIAKEIPIFLSAKAREEAKKPQSYDLFDLAYRP
jgi:hypothetical protein